MDAILNQLSSIAAKADEATRKTILTKLRDFSYSIESSDDTTHRVWGSYPDKHFRAPREQRGAIVCCGNDVLMARILRCLASYGVIKKTGVNEYQRNNVSGHLAQLENAAAIEQYFDACGPIWFAFPTFFEKNGYKNPIDSYNTVWQEGRGSQKSCFEWMMSNPSAFETFNTYMAARRQNQATWFDVYPVLEDVSKYDRKLTSNRVLLIDTGGGLGHRASNFSAKFPELPGKVINMDLPFAVEQAKSMSGPSIEHIGHDFFTPQPVKGAKYYYLRAVLHDWPDNKCQLILQNQIEAMAEDSMILIDDMVLPNQGVTWHVTQVVLTIVAAAAAMERTETQWEALYDSVALKVVHRAVYTSGYYETITALAKK